MINVLIVDDSAFMRQMYKKIVNRESGLNVVATARNGRQALTKIDELKPDVVTLDIEMPVLDGLETLKKIRELSRPLSVIMISALNNRDTVMEALEMGAFDFIPKPSGSISLDIEEISDKLCRQIKAAARSKNKPAQSKKIPAFNRSLQAKKQSRYPVIAIGSSSGGPRALKELLTVFPDDLPAGIIIVQHMPAGFTSSLARRLDQTAKIRVKEASENDKVERGLALLAPGGYHLEINDRNRVVLNKKPKRLGVRPCVDYMMLSVAGIYRARTIGVILTGMGHDGARGMKKIKENNGYGIVEDRSTALVYGMPSATIKEKAYDRILPLDEIPYEIIDIIERRY